MTTLWLCGAGNSEGVRLARQVNARIGTHQRLALLDDDQHRHGGELLGVPIVGALDLLADAGPGDAAVNLVARRTSVRAAVSRRITGFGVPLATLVHPGVDAGDCVLGDGVLVYEQAVLSPQTRLHDGAVVFMRAVVGHESSVGPHCVLAAGCVLNARVRLDAGVYVGSNASVLPEVSIGANATVGANTMVAANVPAGATVVGVPGQILAVAPAGVATAAATVPPGDAAALAEQLLAVLCTVLGRDQVAATDRFFEVGGTSLRAVHFVEAVRATLGHVVPLPVLYARCTMRDLALHLLGQDDTDTVRRAHARALARRRPATTLP